MSLSNKVIEFKIIRINEIKVIKIKVIKIEDIELVLFKIDHFKYLSVMASLTCWGNFEALVFGYIKGASVSTSKRSNGMTLSCNIFRTPSSDLSFQR